MRIMREALAKTSNRGDSLDVLNSSVNKVDHPLLLSTK
jgi:hypothetical protein